MRTVKALIQRHPVSTYFSIAFLLSYGTFLVLDAPKMLRGQAMQAMDAFLLFPIIVVGVGLAGIVLASIVAGRSGLRALFSHMGRWRIGAPWYTTLLIPPACCWPFFSL